MALIYALAYTLFTLGTILSGYLIYRYNRYSDWRQTEIGKAFMLMKVVLFGVLVYNLFATFLPFWGQVAAVFILVIGIDVALLFQLRAVLKLQGGWRREKTPQK